MLLELDCGEPKDRLWRDEAGPQRSRVLISLKCLLRQFI